MSILSAAVMFASTGLAACGTGGVADHDHKWDEGEVTTEPTCHSEGEITYKCTVEGCTQTKTRHIGTTEHSWDNGEETKHPDCKTEGEKTYKCTNEGCTATKTETVGKTPHSWDDGVLSKVPDFYNAGERKLTCQNGCGATKTEPVAAHADFAEQYYTTLTEQNGWGYGYAQAFDAGDGTIEFIPILQSDAQSGTWKEGDVEIGKGYVATGDKKAVVSYSFNGVIPEQIQTNVNISFKGEEDGTVLNAHLIVLDAEGNPAKDSQDNAYLTELNSKGAKDWEYSSQKAIDLKQGYVFYLIFEKAAACTGKAGGELTFTLTSPCIHLWDSGTVKTPATCQKEGVMKYSCLNCSATYEGDIQKTPHNWDDGVVKNEPTETEEGLKKFTCQNDGCNETKTEKIPKLAPSTFNGADFARDFSTTAQPNWEYGYTKNYDFAANTFTFEKAKPVGTDAWKDGGNIEIKGGWLMNETDGSMAVIRYIMPETREITVAMSFNGSNDVTRMSARLHVTDASGNLDGSIKDNPEFIYKADSKGWSLTKTITVQKGGVISVIFTREGSNGWWHGDFNMTLTATGTAPAEEEIANFYEDFGNEDVWVYGYSTDYQWDTNNFTFNQLTANDEDNYTSIDGNNRLEIKKDFVLSEYGGRDLAVGYKVPAGQSKLKVNVDFAGSNAETQIAPRILVVRNNATQSAEFFGDCESKQDWNITHEVNVSEGDIIYVILFPKGDSGYKQGKLQITINGEKAQQPTTGNVITDFAAEFEGTLAGTSNWEVGVVDYHFPAEGSGEHETFTFTKITNKNDGGDAFTDNTGDKWKEIKGDWAAINGMVGFKYTFTNAVNAHVNFHIKGTGSNQYNIRWAITDSEGNVKNEGNQPAWVNGGNEVTLDTDVTVAAGDIFYIFIERNADIDGDQCTYSLVITGEAQQSGPENVITNFNEDFAGTLAGTSNWEVGVVDYKFPEETFTFTKITNKNDGGDAFTDNTGENWKEIKGDWAAINGMAAFRYKFGSAVNAHVNFQIKGTGNNQYNIRWAITDSEGNVKNDGNKPAWVGGGNEVTLDTDVTVAAGDIFYIFIERNADIDGDQCNYSLVITPRA